MSAPVVDPTTGEILGDAPDAELDAMTDVAELRRLAKAYRDQAKGAVLDYERLDREHRSERRKVAKLEAELKEQLQEVPEAQLMRTLFNYWVEKTGRPKKRTKFGDARKKKVLARLREGHAPERIMRAIDGAVLGSTVSNPQAEREALLRVMREAVRMVDDAQGQELRRIYAEALKAAKVERYDDLELICRDETKLERLAALADRIDPLPEPTVVLDEAV